MAHLNLPQIILKSSFGYKICEQVILCLDHFNLNNEKYPKIVLYNNPGVFLSNVVTKQRCWDMFNYSKAILSGSIEQIHTFDPIKNIL